MDAISFVLGVKSAQLRSSQLRDLVYRGRRLARDNGDGTSQPEPEDEEGEGEGTAKKAWVLAVFIDEKSKEWLFQRTCVVFPSLYVRWSHGWMFNAGYRRPGLRSTSSTKEPSPTPRITKLL
jgi:hypothetical protein